jgi:hypothetical protein
MNDGAPRGMIRIDCTCCQIPQFNPDRDGAIPTICDVCYQHRGQSPEKKLARAESHEAMLCQRLAACRASEVGAKKDLADAKEQVRAALTSRGDLADRLVDAVENDRWHNCPAQQLGRERHTVEIARKRAARAGDGLSASATQAVEASDPLLAKLSQSVQHCPWPGTECSQGSA